jgi:thiol-disulfide isomerase/thioredoxin
MKYFVFLFAFLSFTFTVRAQALKPGETIPPIAFNLLGENAEILTSESLEGKAILLDFWATWCSPCIASMEHLDELQQTFEDQLQVIAISEESEERLGRFIEHTDHQFLFARDEGMLREIFPYGIIPHSVLISPTGSVVAITSPEKITREIIGKALRGETVDLPVKKYALNFDPSFDYFQADTNTVSSFTLQPFNPATPAFSKQYYDGPFKGRRLSVYNMNISGLYRLAYGTTIFRVVLEFDESLVDWEQEENRYCADVIVEDPGDLLPEFRRQLSRAQKIKARTERRAQKVVVLRALEEGTLNATPSEPKQGYAGRQDGFSGEGATLEDFRSYLEGFGIFNLPVVNETEIEGTFVIDFSYDPENPKTFKTAMQELGLSYSWEERDIEVLVLYLEE